METKLTFKEKLLLTVKEQKKKANKHVFITTGIVVVLLAAFLIFNQSVEAQITKDEDRVFTASFLGTLDIDSHVEKVIETKGYSYLYENIQPYLSSSDYLSGNFQSSAKGKEAAQSLKIDLLKNSISYVEKNGLKIATLVFTDVAGAQNDGVAPADVKTMLPLVQEAKQNADLVFVHMEWGKEYDTKPSPRMKGLAKAISDAGADVIIGHHSQVLSSVDVYNHTVIFYSMGNFISNQGWSKTKESVLAQYHVNKNGKVKVELIPLRIKNSHPEQLGTMGWFYRGKIFKQLTKYTTNPENWVVENGKLVYQFPSLVQGE